MQGSKLRSSILIITLVMAAGAPEAQTVGAVKLEPVVVGPDRPTGIHHAGDGSGRLFLLSKLGTIHVFDGTQVLPTPFLDITGQVESSGVERGLHGLAFHPDYASNGTFFVCYTDLASDTVVSRWKVSGDPNVADPSSEELVLFADQPDQYHNVSQLAFGPDGYLYVGAGDGGFIGDPQNRAQDLGEILGKILRIDVDAAPYAIPPSNPFVGTPGALPEIWAYGVRNPWRFSFDRANGDLYVGDVGQFSREEVNYQPGDSPGGENYGWRLKEGDDCYDPPSGCEIPGLTDPIHDYAHGFFFGGECAVIGGFVYRGERFPRFDGTYFFADWCSGRVWATEHASGSWPIAEVLDSAMNPQTFGEDEAGELYVADDADRMLYRLIDPVPFCDLAVNQATYAVGDPVVASSARLVNLGDAAAPVRFRLFGVPPGLPPVTLLDLGAGGGFVLPPGLEADFAPFPFFAFTPGMPAGTYTLVCRLEDPFTGALIAEEQAAFDLQ
jgi:glucose/arabinose dehydrogenase